MDPLIVKRKLKQWWATISPIWTKQRTSIHLISYHWAQKRPRHLAFEIQVLPWDMHTKFAGSNR